MGSLDVYIQKLDEDLQVESVFLLWTKQGPQIDYWFSSVTNITIDGVIQVHSLVHIVLLRNIIISRV